MSRADEIERAARRFMEAAELCGPGAPALYDAAMDALYAALGLPPDEPVPEYGVAWMREQIKRRWLVPCVSGSEQMHERDRWLDGFLLTHRAADAEVEAGAAERAKFEAWCAGVGRIPIREDEPGTPGHDRYGDTHGAQAAWEAWQARAAAAARKD